MWKKQTYNRGLSRWNTHGESRVTAMPSRTRCECVTVYRDFLNRGRSGRKTVTVWPRLNARLVTSLSSNSLFSTSMYTVSQNMAPISSNLNRISKFCYHWTVAAKHSHSQICRDWIIVIVLRRQWIWFRGTIVDLNAPCTYGCLQCFTALLKSVINITQWRWNDN